MTQILKNREILKNQVQLMERMNAHITSVYHDPHILKIAHLIDDELAKEIGNRVTKLRHMTGTFHEGVTQEELARQMNCERSVVSRIERGDAKASNNLVKLAIALNVSLEWLVFGVSQDEDGNPFRKQANMLMDNLYRLLEESKECFSMSELLEGSEIVEINDKVTQLTNFLESTTDKAFKRQQTISKIK
ncbi:helix-turn-helix transcriptional regulator [Vibrio parahaemolyticus]|nr:helix-turn-helix transcriptional regulator [Vibrio parahaemolyticus]